MGDQQGVGSSEGVQVSDVQGLGGFDFGPQIEAERRKKQMEDQITRVGKILEDQVVQFGQTAADPRKASFMASGDMIFSGYSPDEVAQLLSVYRKHVQSMGVLASQIDQFRYTPVGPEDITGLDDAR